MRVRNQWQRYTTLRTVAVAVAVYFAPDRNAAQRNAAQRNPAYQPSPAPPRPAAPPSHKSSPAQKVYLRG